MSEKSGTQATKVGEPAIMANGIARQFPDILWQVGDLTVKKHTIYESPPSHVIDQFAGEVCQQLGQRVDVTYNTPEMSRELARFLKVVATICVKAMNKYDQPFASSD